MYLRKKIIAGILAGAFVVGGRMFAYTAEAAEANDDFRPGHNRNFDRGDKHWQAPTREEITERTAKFAKLDKAKVTSLMEKGYHSRDIGMAGLIADKSKKSVESVLDMKKINNSWQDVAKALNVTIEKNDKDFQGQKGNRPQAPNGKQDKSRPNGERPQFGNGNGRPNPPSKEDFAKRIAKTANLDEAKVTSLMKNGYHPRDIEIAGQIAKKSNKSMDSVLNMKKINNSWTDVAKSLNVTLERNNYHYQGSNRPNRPGRQGRPSGQYGPGAHHNGQYCPPCAD